MRGMVIIPERFSFCISEFSNFLLESCNWENYMRKHSSLMTLHLCTAPGVCPNSLSQGLFPLSLLHPLPVGPRLPL